MRAGTAIFSLSIILASPLPAFAAGGDKGPPSDDAPGDVAASPPDVPSDDAAAQNPAPPGAAPSPTAPASPTPTPATPPKRAPALSAKAGDAEADTASVEITPARDTLGGHVVIGALAGLFVPFGSFESGVTQQRLLDTGLAVGGDIGFGVSRTLVLGVYGEVGLPSTTSECTGCSVTSIALGPMVRYHLVQGLRFDPWLSAGVGFRRTSTGHDTFTGIDWTRIELGGDYYPWPSLGFGPFVALSLGTYFDATSKITTTSVNGQFSVGLRIVFDGPGK
jgi:hypothetical protein